ncbi:hypothetical protein [Moraxella cuniculi]|nr:hypothetical protein [Moraxella cuniculi]
MEYRPVVWGYAVLFGALLAVMMVLRLTQPQTLAQKLILYN